jgi:hypothetical protein
MTREEIIVLAYNIGICEANGEDDNSKNISAQIEHFANVVAAAEREECAKLCRQTEPFYGVMFADAIRAKGVE